MPKDCTHEQLVLIPTRLSELAAKAIEIQKKIAPDLADLEAIKTRLRDEARGDTYSIPVAGQGKVSISRPTAPSSVRVYEANHDAIANLPAKERKDLLNRGLISYVVHASKGRAASIQLSLNI